ncbi:MAG: thiosulfate oxidation carrier complex protein SoxZ [Gammaproteobacteria bacterium]|nr:thiosulfate oxidation carrier complex protein SoxZ [Gammaproteobacteria bacterium]MCW5586493.1 thiosulfate oxidation carrier complex protein SoxZ [Chromatiales bacterium]
MGGKTVMTSQCSDGIFRNPYLSFSFVGASKGCGGKSAAPRAPVAWAADQRRGAE